MGARDTYVTIAGGGQTLGLMIFLISFTGVIYYIYTFKRGCLDENAYNYDENAIIDNTLFKNDFFEIDGSNPSLCNYTDINGFIEEYNEFEDDTPQNIFNIQDTYPRIVDHSAIDQEISLFRIHSTYPNVEFEIIDGSTSNDLLYSNILMDGCNAPDITCQSVITDDINNLKIIATNLIDNDVILEEIFTRVDSTWTKLN